jgi:predicted phage terminase large subunit-like protein
MEFESIPACRCGTCVGENVFGWRDWRSVDGDVIHPRFTPEFLAGERVRLGSLGYAGQMQQRPMPATGGLFGIESFARRWTTLPSHFDRVVISLDASFKAGSASDYAVVQTWGALKGDRYLIEQWRKQADFVPTRDALKAAITRWPFAKVLVEEGANGHAIISQLRLEMPGIVAVKPIGGKRSRALSVQGIVESGACVLPGNAPWLNAWLDEACSFTGVGDVHDDQVDAMVYALRELQVHGATPHGGFGGDASSTIETTATSDAPSIYALLGGFGGGGGSTDR